MLYHRRGMVDKTFFDFFKGGGRRFGALPFHKHPGGQRKRIVPGEAVAAHRHAVFLGKGNHVVCHGKGEIPLRRFKRLPLHLVFAGHGIEFTCNVVILRLRAVVHRTADFEVIFVILPQFLFAAAAGKRERGGTQCARKRERHYFFESHAVILPL